MIFIRLAPSHQRGSKNVMDITWTSRDTIQIGVSVYAGSYLEHLRRCIESCLIQEDVEWILTIRADGIIEENMRSYINSIAQSDSRIFFLDGGSRLGTYGSYKIIFEKSNSEYLCQLDSDDYLAPKALSKCLSAFHQNQKLSFVYTDCIDIDADGSPLGMDSHSTIPYSRDALLTSFMTFHLRLISRAKYQLIGGYDDQFKYCGDYDLCLRLSEVGEVFHLNRHCTFIDFTRTVHLNHSRKTSSRSLSPPPDEHLQGEA